MKKVIGAINLMVGLSSFFGGFVYIFSTVPRVIDLYEQMGVDIGYDPSILYYYSVAIILYGIFCFVVGLANFDLVLQDRSEMLYKIGLFVIFLSLALTGIVTAYAVNVLTETVYNFDFLDEI